MRQKIKQSFSFQGKDGRIFGCSFKLAPNGQYWGWVTEYENKAEYNYPREWIDYKNIPLTETVEASITALKRFCETL